jgi:hypothetical protein
MAFNPIGITTDANGMGWLPLGRPAGTYTSKCML